MDDLKVRAPERFVCFAAVLDDLADDVALAAFEAHLVGQFWGDHVRSHGGEPVDAPILSRRDNAFYGQPLHDDAGEPILDDDGQPVLDRILFTIRADGTALRVTGAFLEEIDHHA